VIREVPKDREKANITPVSRKKNQEAKKDVEQLGSEGCDQ